MTRLVQLGTAWRDPAEVVAIDPISSEPDAPLCRVWIRKDVSLLVACDIRMDADEAARIVNAERTAAGRCEHRFLPDANGKCPMCGKDVP